MDELVLSESGGTSLRVTAGRWVVYGRGSSTLLEDAIYGLLPLLERDPAEALIAVAALEGPQFPYEDVLLTALESNSGYWQERAVRWLEALELEPVGALAEAARRATNRKLASQQHRQQLLRWLRGKPMRRA